ncbi:MAG TPA: AAA-like domain-containing protein, partial [Chthonomonadaceae bacterium]|nr:AAA-like domain-containing protein [Chthonomonadaceae bacterium]
MSQPFYITGGTLPTDASSYVVRQADEDLLAALQRGEFCYVLNTRQMGKSSLMVRTAARLKQEGVRVCVLDLTAVGQNLMPEQWYGGLLVRLSSQINLETELMDFWLAHAHLGPMQRFFAA